VGENVVEALQLSCQLERRKSQENHTDVWLPASEDQLPEVSIFSDEDALLSRSDGKHLVIWERGRVIKSDDRNIVAEPSKIRCKATVSTLVKEEPHAGWLG